MALEGATISVGAIGGTSDASGHFELTGVPVGPATVRAERPGYMPAEATVTVSAGANTQDFALTVQEIYESGAYKLLVPAGIGPIRGVIISLGEGVTTSGFVDGGSLAPNEGAELEQSLQQLGASLRATVRSTRVALLGTTIHNLANGAASDDALFTAMANVGELSGHAELAAAPVLTFGLADGSLEAAGLVARHPERSIGVLARVPSSMPDLTAPSALAVPTLVMLSEGMGSAQITPIQATFSGNRSRGGLWALQVEPGARAAEATGEGNAANVEWIAQALALRLPATAGDPLIALPESSGWLGHQTTLEIAPWADYTGDRATASWLPSEDAAVFWKNLGTADGGGGGEALRTRLISAFPTRTR
jgi:hypothetical protein